MYQRSTYFNKISADLTLLAHTVANKNKLSLTDDSKWSEDFFKELLNNICEYQLINLNTQEQNYAGIDLGDSTKSICVQVTATNTSQKIKDTLAVSDKYKRHEEYDDLIVFIVGFKKKSNTTFSSKFSNFDNDCIWDIRTLLAKIYPLSADRMKKLADFLDSELSGVITIDPIELLDQDISLIIDTLSDYAQNNLGDIPQDSQQKYKLVKRGDDFITHKNELNKVDGILFNSEIRPSLQYDKQIETFLGNPINDIYQKKYFVFTEALQKRYSENPEQFKNIGELFGFVFDEIINYENRNEVDDQKLLIVLHNMYFNCDIGNNPSQ